jgi:hypothetical protein
MSHRSSRLAAAVLAAAAAAALAGCGETNLVRDGFVAAGIGAKVPEAPEFVRNSRAARTDYLPVGVSAPPRPVVSKTVPEVKAGEAELDTLRGANEAKAADTRQVGAGVTTPAPASR